MYWQEAAHYLFWLAVGCAPGATMALLTLPWATRIAEDRTISAPAYVLICALFWPALVGWWAVKGVKAYRLAWLDYLAKPLRPGIKELSDGEVIRRMTETTRVTYTKKP